VNEDENSQSHRRRPRYKGKYPRRFEEKYKEHNPHKYPETIARVIASGKTPAGSHLPIMVNEVLEILDPRPGDTVIDCTLGYGGHARSLLDRIGPDGLLVGLDADPVELPHTEERMRNLGFGPEVFHVHRSNFAGLPKILAAEGLSGVDCILADLGVSSMQMDNPARGFSLKHAGPLDMRMNPNKGQAVSTFLQKVIPETLVQLLRENADEPHAEAIANGLAGKLFTETTELADFVRLIQKGLREEEREKSVRRVFQALRIAVNEEFTALDTLLRYLPECLNVGGRVAILTFHSGEDRRVKKAFWNGLDKGRYAMVANEVIRPSAEECRVNPRATSAKLRWGFR
jgi:16S rRNA (cytosine1402-N4)-methyltransferase